MAPMISEHSTLTNAQGAVIATSPASVPLTIMDRSGLPSSNQAVIVEVKVAMTAAMFVVTAMWPMETGSSAIVLPGLKPNQPNQRTSAPIQTEVMLCPGIALTWPLAP